jgi:tetratricopeptide (TPR) repeat protein
MGGVDSQQADSQGLGELRLSDDYVKRRTDEIISAFASTDAKPKSLVVLERQAKSLDQMIADRQAKLADDQNLQNQKSAIVGKSPLDWLRAGASISGQVGGQHDQEALDSLRARQQALQDEIEHVQDLLDQEKQPMSDTHDAVGAKDWAAAETGVNQLVSIDPSSVDFLRDLLFIQQQKGDEPSELATTTDSLQKVGTDDPDAQYDIAYLLLQQKNLPGAEKEAKTAVRLGGQERAYELVGYIEAQEGSLYEAMDYYCAAAEATPDLATVLAARKQVGQAAEKGFPAVQGMNKGEGYNDDWMGRAYAAEGRLPDAEVQLGKAVASDASSITYKMDLARALTEDNKLAQAEQILQSAVKADGSNPEVQVRLTHLLLKEKKVEDAFATLQSVLKLDPTNRALVSDEQEIFTGLTALYGDQVTRDSSNPVSHFNYGEMLIRTGSMSQGIGELQTAAAMGNKPEYWYEVARVLVETHPQMAVDAISKAIDLDKSNAGYYAARAVCFLASCDDHDFGFDMSHDARMVQIAAKKNLEQAIRLDPSSGTYHSLHAQLNYWVGDSATKAQEELQTAILASPQDPNPKAALATMLGHGPVNEDRKQTQRYQKASDLWRQAIAIQPDNAWLHAGLALALSAQGWDDDATKEQDVALRLGLPRLDMDWVLGHDLLDHFFDLPPLPDRSGFSLGD